MIVLDSNFHIRSINGLRIVDGSVFPRIQRFFIASPVYMVGEQASDVIVGCKG
jgi:choline dehydrogenase